MNITKRNISLIVIILLLLIARQSVAVTASPEPVRFVQPDGSVVTLVLHGDEYIHWATTTDGYTVLSAANGFYQYASTDVSGNLGFSGIAAHDPGTRNASETALVSTLKKALFFSKEQLAAMRSMLAANGSPTSPPPAMFPTTGTRKLLMILSNFSNTTTTYTQANFNNFMNQANYNGTGSFRDFYLEVSFGALTVNTTVTVWVTVPNVHDYYGPSSNWGEFAYESVVAANNQTSINFAEFDNDADGVVDGVAIIHQGRGQEESGNVNDIWSHSWDLLSAGYSAAQRTFDGVQVLDYTAQPELANAGGSMANIGVMCHEFGHNLGSPDFYDTDYGTSGYYIGTGQWDCMANGSWNGGGTKPAHHNAWTKTFFGWVTPVVMTTQQTRVLRNAQVYPDAARYNTTTANEYFLCENRQKTGFDVSIPGHGLIIYHVDGDYITAHSGDNDINATEHQGMYPMSATSATANGINPSGSSTINTGSCPFPGTASKTSFTDLTTPNAKSWAGNNTNGPLTNITENTTTKEITFCFIACNANDPMNFTATASGGSQINLAWLLNAGSNPVILAYNTTSTFGTPANGTAYTSGSTIPGGGTVIYAGSALSFNHINLNPTTTYYYKIWSVMAGTTYSTGATASATTLCGTYYAFPFTENFSSSSFPSCWSQAPNDWTVSSSNNCGGDANEIMATWTNINPGTTRLKTFTFSTIGLTSVNLSFKHYVDDYGPGATLRIQSSSDGINWTNEAWSMATTSNSNFGPFTINTTITNNLNSPTTMIAFTVTGNLYQFDFWYIDNVVISAPGYWIGGTAGNLNNWSTAANWGDGIVPSPSTNVIIPPRTYLPVVNNDPATPAECNNLTILGTATVTVSTGKKMVVNGSMMLQNTP